MHDIQDHDVPAFFQQRALLNDGQYQAMYQRSINDPNSGQSRVWPGLSTGFQKCPPEGAAKTVQSSGMI
jgi:hypothetical protein